MGSIAVAAVHVHARRSITRLLGIAPAALLLSGLFTVWAGPLAARAEAAAPPVGVVAWGENTYGESTVPAGLSGVTAIAAGQQFSLALKSNGTVVAWGDNDYGATDVPAGLSGVTAISAGVHFGLALKSNGTVVAWGDYGLAAGGTDVPAGLSAVKAVAAGGYYGLALKSDGTVVAWGSDSDGQRDVPVGLSGVAAIAAGTDDSYALKSDGTVVCWGVQNNGRCDPAGLSGVTAIAAANEFSLFLLSNGTVVGWGPNDAWNQTDVPAGLSGVTAIAAGWNHSLALKSDGTVVAWGRNLEGQANVPAGLSGVTAIAAGGCHSLALVPPPYFTVSGLPSPTVAGVAHGVTVTAKDAHGNTATGYSGTVRFTSPDGAAVLPANATLAAGVGTFSVILKTAGTQSVTATDTLTSSITGTQSGIVVTPAAATTLAVSGLTTPRTAGTTGSIRVTAVDAYGNRVHGYLGTIHFTSSDAKAKLPANYTFTAADAGTHVFSGAVILKTAGTQSVTATDTVTKTIKGAQTGIVVKAAAVKTLTVSGLTTPRTKGVAGTIRVTAVDAYGNRVSGYTGTIHFTSTDTKAKLPANYTFKAADAGTHVFSVTLKTAGTQSVTATDTVTKTIKGSQIGIVVR